MTRTSTQDLQEEFLAALNQGQKTMIGALRIWVETAQAVTPKLTGVYAPLTDKLPKLPSVTVPFADKLPSPHQAVDNAYGLAEELLANQRKFAEDVLDTAARLLPGNGKSAPNGTAPKRIPVTPAPKPAAAKAPQPTAAKAPQPTAAKAPAPKTSEPAASAPKAPQPAASAPKVAPPKAAQRKPAARKPVAPKPASPKATALKPTPSTKPGNAS
jgi:hypothetical protein